VSFIILRLLFISVKFSSIISHLSCTSVKCCTAHFKHFASSHALHAVSGHFTLHFEHFAISTAEILEFDNCDDMYSCLIYSAFCFFRSYKTYLSPDVFLTISFFHSSSFVTQVFFLYFFFLQSENKIKQHMCIRSQ
jgi:hypothetical protein